MGQIDGTIQRSYTKYVIAFVFVALVTIGVIVYFTFSKTVITIFPEPQTVDASFTVHMAEDTDESSESAFPARLISVTVDGSDVFSGSGEVRTETGIAAGTVTLKNTSGTPQPLVATTRLLSEDGILFRLDNAVTVPANGEIEAAVTADQEGEESEIGPTTFTIPGLNTSRQQQVFAESTSAMVGGVHEITALSAEDISAAKDAMVQRLYDEALTELEHQVAISDSPYKVILPGAIHRIVGYEEVDAQPGDERSEFRVSMAMKVTAVLFSEQSLLSKVTEQLETQLAQGMELQTVTNEDLYYSVNRLDANAGTAELAVLGSAPALITLNSSLVEREPILNKDAQDIRAYFTNFSEIADVKVDFSPFWVVRAPSLVDHIEIRIEEPLEDQPES